MEMHSFPLHRSQSMILSEWNKGSKEEHRLDFISNKEILCIKKTRDIVGINTNHKAWDHPKSIWSWSNLEAYLGIEHLLVRTEFLAIGSCNPVKLNPVNLFLHRVIYVWMIYLFYMDPFYSFDSCSSRMIKNYHVRFLRGMDL